MHSPLCSTTFCHFSSNFIISSFQNFLSFLNKELLQVPFAIFMELNFFPFREFCKDWNTRIPKVHCLMNTVDESELTSQPVKVFAWSSKKRVVLPYPERRLYVFCWLIVDNFFRVLLSFSLIGSSTCWN